MQMSVIVAFVLAVGVPAVAANPPKGQHYAVNFVTKLSYDQLFFDGFDGDLSAWQWISGAGASISGPDGRYCAVSGGLYVGGVVVTAGSESWTDYSLEFDVQKASGKQFSVVFRYKDASNYYLLQLTETARIGLYSRVGGTFSELGKPWPTQVMTPGMWYHYEIVVQGTSIKVYVDHVLRIDVVDNSLPAGKIGIGAWSNSVAYFDNVQVNGLHSDEILIGVNATVAGLQYVAGDAFKVLDHDAGVRDGDCAVLQVPLSAAYDVWCSGVGRPGGSITWGISEQRLDAHTSKPTWAQHLPDNFSLDDYGSPLGPYAITTANDATALTTRWYPQ
jgi:hypothetical protein